MRVPKWSNGAIVAVQNDDTPYPLIWVVDQNGTRTIPFHVSNAAAMHIYDWDLGADGTIGLSGFAADTEGRLSGFIATLSPGGWESNVIRTESYRPGKVAIAHDGTIWTAGQELVLLNNGKRSSSMLPNAAVIRHYTKSGKVIGEHIPQSTVGDSLLLSNQHNALRASRDRIAWYSSDGRLVEIQRDGRMLLDEYVRPPIGDAPYQITGFGLTDAGEVYLSITHALATKGAAESVEVTGVYSLARSTKTWVELDSRSGSARGRTTSDGSRQIHGVEGNQLVLSGNKRMQFYEVGK
jgi:hypothetical protein